MKDPKVVVRVARVTEVPAEKMEMIKVEDLQVVVRVVQKAEDLQVVT